MKYIILLFALILFSKGDVFQFDSSLSSFVGTNNQSRIFSWQSVNSSTSLHTIHQTSDVWELPSYNEGVFFYEASPMGLDEACTNIVKRIIAVVDCNEARPWSTLIDCVPPIAIAPYTFNDFVNAFSSSNDLADSIVTVNRTNQEFPLEEKFVVDIEFVAENRLCDIYVGGSPATPLWNRSWNGCIYELLFFTHDISEENANAIYSYLGLKYGIGDWQIEGTQVLQALNDLNIKVGSLYTTIILMR